MSEIKPVIALLCKYLNMSIDTCLKPEHIRLAKFNEKSNEAVEGLWTALHVFSSRALTMERYGSAAFRDYDKRVAVKLCLAYLQYPTIEFYALPTTEDCSTRQLLLALAWLFATRDVLGDAIRHKLASSALGREYSVVTEAEKTPPPNDRLSSFKDQTNRVIYTCGRISHNMKEISELMDEKVKLTAKVHAASLAACGLPHLSVSEMAMTKRLSASKSKNFCEEDEQRLRELHASAVMLDVRAKWTKKSHVFFTWMATVIEEHKKCQSSGLDEEARDELLRFARLLRHITKKNLHNLKHGSTESDPPIRGCCASRFLRIQNSRTEAEDWLSEAATRLERAEMDARKSEEELAAELKTLLRLIPHCVQV